MPQNVITMLDWFLLNTFFSCRREFGWLVSGWKAKDDSPDKSFGIAYHKMMEEFYKKVAGDKKRALEWEPNEEDLLRWLPEAQFSSGKYDRGKLPALLRGYRETYKELLRDVSEVLTVESAISAGVGPYRWCAKVDTTVKLTNKGRTTVWGLEHKTSSRALGMAQQTNYLFRDGQISGQLLVLANAFENFAGVEVQHVEIGGGVHTGVDVAYRGEGERREDNFVDIAFRAFEQINACLRGGYWPMNLSRCYRFQKLCPYWHLCQTGSKDDLLPDVWVPGVGWNSKAKKGTSKGMVPPPPLTRHIPEEPLVQFGEQPEPERGETTANVVVMRPRPLRSSLINMSSEDMSRELAAMMAQPAISEVVPVEGVLIPEPPPSGPPPVEVQANDRIGRSMWMLNWTDGPPTIGRSDSTNSG